MVSSTCYVLPSTNGRASGLRTPSPASLVDDATDCFSRRRSERKRNALGEISTSPRFIAAVTVVVQMKWDITHLDTCFTAFPPVFLSR